MNKIYISLIMLLTLSGCASTRSITVERHPTHQTARCTDSEINDILRLSHLCDKYVDSSDYKNCQFVAFINLPDCNP